MPVKAIQDRTAQVRVEKGPKQAGYAVRVPRNPPPFQPGAGRAAGAAPRGRPVTPRGVSGKPPGCNHHDSKPGRQGGATLPCHPCPLAWHGSARLPESRVSHRLEMALGMRNRRCRTADRHPRCQTADGGNAGKGSLPTPCPFCMRHEGRRESGDPSLSVSSRSEPSLRTHLSGSLVRILIHSRSSSTVAHSSCTWLLCRIKYIRDHLCHNLRFYLQDDCLQASSIRYMQPMGNSQSSHLDFRHDLQLDCS